MLQKCTVFRVASVFFNEPTKKHYLLEVSKKSNLAHTSVKNNLKKLVRQKIIKESFEMRGKRKFPLFDANLESAEYKRLKKLYNLSVLDDSGIIGFLRDTFFPKSIVLFGSYSRGEDIEDSDIDIFIESKQKDLSLLKYSKILKRKIQLHFKTEFGKYPAELKNNIINGVVLAGFLEGF